LETWGLDILGYYINSGDTKYGAKGLAYDQGRLINRATIFGTQSGMAIGGELGTEAIMPLARGPDGRLGVSSNGGSSQQPININFTINAVDSKGIDQLLSERKTMITNLVRSAVNEKGKQFAF
jgi:phage-related minor tail protein